MGIGGGGGGFSFQKGEEKEKKNITFIRVPSLDRRATVTYMYRWGSGGMMFSTCGNASSPPPHLLPTVKLSHTSSGSIFEKFSYF